jgi:hypothetical protein
VSRLAEAVLLSHDAGEEVQFTRGIRPSPIHGKQRLGLKKPS